MEMATLRWSGVIAVINQPKFDGTTLSHSPDVPIQVKPGPLLLSDANKQAIGRVDKVRLEGDAVLASGICHFCDREEAASYLSADTMPVDIDTQWITRMTHRISASPEGRTVIHNWRISKVLIVPEPAWAEAAIAFTEQEK
jgi:hypothetical protein